MSLQADVKNKLAPSTVELLERLAIRQAGPERYRQPVAIIGPGNGQPMECTAAYIVAACLAGAGVPIVCGGRGGVMQAASRGAAEAGGIAIGILPEEDLQAANPYLTVAIPTGMGEMRNAIIARCASCLVAVGGGLGTVSEMALGLKWNKRVFTLYADLALPGTDAALNVGHLVELVAAYLLDPFPDDGVAA
ncbi:TIGR00725 family protein [Paludibacterium yongneupense]|uniref:TIGR00725 family protein n=1 Tax=Paludibacterium yongneupense TaxID=400061 RepID=UPI00048D9519|nr:TIGR00725 family protein [Paludibacterium yongneupense]